MSESTEMRDRLHQVRKALELTASPVNTTFRGRATMGQGTVTTYEEKNVRIVLDLPAEVGGTNTAPSPGKMMRAALAGCIALGIRMEAEYSGVPIESVTVDLEADSDDRADFGIHDTPPGYTKFRLRIDAVSAAPEADVRGAIDRSLAQSPVLDAIHKAQDMTLETVITAPAAAG